MHNAVSILQQLLVAKATLELAGLGQSVSQLVCLVSKSQTFQFHHYDVISAQFRCNIVSKWIRIKT